MHFDSKIPDHKTNLEIDEIEEKFRNIKKPESYIGSTIQTTPKYHGNAKKAKVISTTRKVYQTKLMSRKSLTEEKVSLTVNNAPIGKATQLFAHSRYRNGLRQLFKNSKSAKKAAVCDVVRQEICSIAKMVSKSSFNGEPSSILDFEWDKMMYDANKCCPSLLELIKKHYHNIATKRIGRKVVSLVPVIGSLLCIINFIRTRHSTVLQQLVSIIMWLGGCKRKVFGSFNRPGWCQSIDAT